MSLSSTINERIRGSGSNRNGEIPGKNRLSHASRHFAARLLCENGPKAA